MWLNEVVRCMKNHTQEIFDACARKAGTKQAPGKRKFGQMVRDGAKMTSNEEHTASKKLSKRYIHDFAKENNINEANGEIIDQPHKTALLDPHGATWTVLQYGQD